MSGKQSRARRVEASRAARSAVYQLKGIGSPPNPFADERQRRIFDKAVETCTASYWKNEHNLQHMYEVYGGTP